MTVRTEQQADYESVYWVIKCAFETAEQSDGNEQDLVNALRQSNAFIPELSLVSEINGKIVGHILFTKLQIGRHTALALAPLSVLPPYQRQGIGTSLILEGHKIAQALGYSYSVVLGSEKYYPRIGYLPAEKFGIQPCFEVPSKNFMAYKLCENAPIISGIVKYAEEFGIT
ncbi:GNAT family N-acetyltransferase [Hominifimenecus sp. rT4P-3]|uniref:GNAT family N-acetyltransferase n=1 Tax=Hominifimenecus sp. rT4P-3 TaxID=3242979 RepID=UPI003DA2846D